MHKYLGPVIVSVIVLLGFIVISFMAMKPEYAAVKQEVVLFLLGAWSTLTGLVVNFWMGSSSGSKDKDPITVVAEKKQ